MASAIPRNTYSRVNDRLLPPLSPIPLGVEPPMQQAEFSLVLRVPRVYPGLERFQRDVHARPT